MSIDELGEKMSFVMGAVVELGDYLHRDRGYFHLVFGQMGRFASPAAGGHGGGGSPNWYAHVTHEHEIRSSDGKVERSGETPWSGYGDTLESTLDELIRRAALDLQRMIEAKAKAQVEAEEQGAMLRRLLGKLTGQS
jgi:hypothetical protein